jgi:polysaccharide pyruvyl transferase WcaK-like protein
MAIKNNKLKVLLGGIPLGCNNIGDEAILAGVVHIFRELFPDVEITVCTASSETADLLHIQCAPLYGFDSALSLSDFVRLAAEHDLFCWCGATGLSDYPKVGLKLLEYAQKKIPTFVWGVGMDEQFNPAHFQISGKKKKLLQLAGFLSCNTIDFVSMGEQWLIKRIYAAIRNILPSCRLVVMRDQESLECLKKSGFCNAIYAADSAIYQETAKDSPIRKIPGLVKIGFCISEQRKITNEQSLIDLWRRLQNRGYHLVFIPMNPITDRALMQRLSTTLEQQKIEWVNSTLPAEVQAAAQCCDVIVSSRLHLLILAANVRTPLIGIARGSKVSNFLKNFDLTPAGNVDQCDFAKIESEIERFQSGGDIIFKNRAEEAYDEMRQRLDFAKNVLKTEILRIASEGNPKYSR